MRGVPGLLAPSAAWYHMQASHGPSPVSVGCGDCRHCVHHHTPTGRQKLTGRLAPNHPKGSLGPQRPRWQARWPACGAFQVRPLT